MQPKAVTADALNDGHIDVKELRAIEEMEPAPMAMEQTPSLARRIRASKQESEASMGSTDADEAFAGIDENGDDGVVNSVPLEEERTSSKTRRNKNSASSVLDLIVTTIFDEDRPASKEKAAEPGEQLPEDGMQIEAPASSPPPPSDSSPPRSSLKLGLSVLIAVVLIATTVVVSIFITQR
mmetsp:Transcript_16656/g.35263  ORF Transcript_16656/g.35263 Transcript_16656/m.35263 type:complete len:181 (+) Transcript_16656:91-633(+)